MKKIEAYMREKYPDEFKPPFDVEPMEKKISGCLNIRLNCGKHRPLGVRKAISYSNALAHLKTV